MSLPAHLLDVPGAAELHDWFGYWPNFHDGEVIQLRLSRTGTSSMLVHAFQMTSQLDKDGYYVLDKDILVEFQLEGVSDLGLEGFNHQNVIFSLTIEKTENGYRPDMHSSYGLAGTIDASAISLRQTPGKPPNESTR